MKARYNDWTSYIAGCPVHLGVVDKRLADAERDMQLLGSYAFEDFLAIHRGSTKSPFSKYSPEKPNVPAPFVCEAIGVIFSTSAALNARISSANIHIPDLETLKQGTSLADFPWEKIQQNFVSTASRFFQELYEVYFAVFGRTNTLNEFVLSRLEPQPEGGLDDSPQNSAQRFDYEMILLTYDAETNEAIRVTAEAKVLHMTFSHKVAKALRGECLDREFFLQSLRSFHDADSSRTRHNWIPAALRRLEQPQIKKNNKSLIRLLLQARHEAEDVLLAHPGDLSESLRNLYPKSIEPAPAHAISRLLRMLQGNLCLVPWANINGLPCPIVIIPIRERNQEPTPMDYYGSWTFVLATCNIPNIFKEAQKPFCIAARTYFRTLAGQHRQVLARNAGNNSISMEETLDLIERDKDWVEANLPFLKCQSRDNNPAITESFQVLLSAAQSLTGDCHEGRPVSYTFIYGEPSLLRHLGRVLSIEDPQPEDPGSGEHSKFTKPKNKEELERDSKRLRLKVAGHYALFSNAGVVGYVDPYHGNHGVSRIALLADPSPADVLDMRQEGIIEDGLMPLRWLTWKEKEGKLPAIALMAGGDGILRLIIKGRQQFLWHLNSAKHSTHWRKTVEYIGAVNNIDTIKDITKRIEKHLTKCQAASSNNNIAYPAGTPEISSIADSLTRVISEISASPGHGAVFVIANKETIETVLPGMVPDGARMEWAKDRRLSDMEYCMLKSLAIMDGFVLIDNTNPEQPCIVRARRYVGAGVPAMDLAKNTAAWKRGRPAVSSVDKKAWKERGVVDYIMNAAAMTTCAHARMLNPDVTTLGGELVELAERIGTKGSRHRSVLQLCMWACSSTEYERSDGPLVCSISADGPITFWWIEYCKGCDDQADIGAARKARVKDWGRVREWDLKGNTAGQINEYCKNNSNLFCDGHQLWIQRIEDV